MSEYLPFEALLALIPFGSFALAQWLPGLTGEKKNAFLVALGVVLAGLVHPLYPETEFMGMMAAFIAALGGSYVNAAAKATGLKGKATPQPPVVPPVSLLLLAVLALGAGCSTMDTQYVDDSGAWYQQKVRAGFGAKINETAGQCQAKWSDGAAVTIGQNAAGIDQRAQAEMTLGFFQAAQALAPIFAQRLAPIPQPVVVAPEPEPDPAPEPEATVAPTPKATKATKAKKIQ